MGSPLVGLVLRGLLALSLLGSAYVHWAEWQNWASFNDVVGPLFLLNVVAGVVLAVAVVVWRHWLPVLLGFGFGVATLAAYVLALTVGLFGVKQQFTSAAETWGVVTDLGCIVAGGALLLVRDWRQSSRETV